MDTNTTQETQFVFRRLEEALRLFGQEANPYWFWILVLLVVVGLGFTYVAWMYKRDSQSVGWPAAVAWRTAASKASGGIRCRYGTSSPPRVQAACPAGG